MPLFLNILRLLTGALGLCLVYLAAFTYESTDRRIQNWLEDLWLRMAYDTRTPAALAKRLGRVVLVLMDKIFDRVFGASQLSIRTFSVALCYAYGALLESFIPLSLLARLAELDLDPFLNAHRREEGIVAAVAFVMGTSPVVHSSLRWVTYLTASWILTSFALTGWAVTTRRPEVSAVIGSIEDPGGLLAPMVVAITCGIGVVQAIRYGVHKSVKREATRQDLVIIGSILMIPFVAFAAPASVALIARRPRGQLTLWLSSLLHRKEVMFLLFSMAAPNSLWGLGLLIFVALSLIVLFHILMWPVIRFFLMKMVYAIQRHDLITRKANLWSTGLGLVLCAAVPRELWKLVTMIIAAFKG